MRQISSWLGRRRRRVWERCQTGCCLNGGSDFAASASSEFTSSRRVFQDFGDNALIFESYFGLTQRLKAGFDRSQVPYVLKSMKLSKSTVLKSRFHNEMCTLMGKSLSRRETDRAISGVGALILASSSESEAVTI